MSLHIKSEVSIYSPRESLMLRTGSRKRSGTMPKLMVQRGKNNIWYAHCRFMGVFLHDCLGTSDKRWAERELATLKSLVERGAYRAWKKTFKECIADWLSDLDMKRPNHICHEINIRLHIAPFFGDLKIREIIACDEETGKSMVTDYLNSIDHRPKETVQKLRHNLVNILRKGKKDYNLPESKFSNKGFYQDRFLAQEEFHEILELMEDDEYRQVAIMMAYTGLDLSDVLKMEWSCIDRTHQMIRTERRKTRHLDRIIKLKIPMNGLVKGVLQNRQSQRRLHDKRIFHLPVKGDRNINRVRTMQRKWKKAVFKSSVEWNVRLKDLRHFFGSYLLNSGVDAIMIAEFMGHSSTDMLYKRYGHFTDEKRREAISLFDKGTKSTECGQNVPKNNSVSY